MSRTSFSLTLFLVFAAMLLAKPSFAEGADHRVLVYRLNVSGEVHEEDSVHRTRRAGRAYLVIDPDNELVTALYWLRYRGELYPMVQDWNDGDVTIVRPNGRRGSDQFLTSIGSGYDFGSYRSLVLEGNRLRHQFIGGAKGIALARVLRGDFQFSAFDFGLVRSAPYYSESLLDLRARARYDARETKAQNEANNSYYDVVEALAEELGLWLYDEDTAPTAAEAEPAGYEVEHAAVYRYLFRARTEGGEDQDVTLFRGWLLIDFAAETAELILYWREGRERYYEVVSLSCLEEFAYRQFGDFGFLTSLYGYYGAGSANGGYVDAVSRLWDGRILGPVDLGSGVELEIPRRLSGYEVELTQDCSYDIATSGRSRLDLDLRASRAANEDSLFVVRERLLYDLYIRHYREFEAEPE